jgi:transcriptional regulator with XRE-family HTH domain
MALFFDAEWFEARLDAAHLSRADLGRALGLSGSEIAAMWKDQRELSAREVTIIAALLGAAPEDVAAHGGVSTPVPAQAGGDIAGRLARIEQALAELKSLILELKRPRS